MNIVPSEQVGPLRFGVSIEDVEQILGCPSTVDAFDEWCQYEYAGEITDCTFRHGKLQEIGVAPNQTTSICGMPIFRIPAKGIEELIVALGHSPITIPRNHPAIRDRINAPALGLYFYIKDGCCDDLQVCAPGPRFTTC